MKRLSVLLVTLLMIFSSTVAFATTVTLPENADQFDITMELPDGAQATEPILENDYTMVIVDMNNLASVYVMLAPSDVYAGQSLADLTEEDVANLQAQTAEDLDDPVSETKVTPSGNQYILVQDKGEHAGATIFTLYKGYFIQLSQFHEDFSAINDDDLDFMMNILYGIEFIDK